MASGYENTTLIPHNFEKVGDKWTTWTTYTQDETILSYTIPETGLYLFMIQFSFNSNTISNYTHTIKIKMDGGGVIGTYQIQASSETLRTPVSISAIYNASAGRIVYVTCDDGNPTPINVRLIDMNNPSSSYALKLK